MNEECKETLKNKKLPVRNRIMCFLGILINFSIVFWMLGLVSGLSGMEFKVLIIFGFIFGACTISAGFASFIYGYKVFMPLERQGWIKNKLLPSATLSIFLFIILTISFPISHPYTLKFRDYQVKSELHYFLVSCQTYWKEKGDDKVCDLKIASQEYGYAQSESIFISAKGNEEEFFAQGQHGDRSVRKFFAINAKGTIFEYTNTQKSWYWNISK